LGGFGDSEAPAGEPIVQYANNDGWHDDTSDGPVSATVVLHADGREIKVTPAHVLVAPTDFAPATENIVTLFDVAEHVALTSGKEPPPGDGVVFSRDILPLLQRAVGYTWVSALALRGHGDGYAGDFLSKDRLAKLADPAKSAAPIRQALFKRFRNPLKMSPDEANAYYMPQLWGDGGQGDTTSPPTGDPQTWLYITETQYARLAKWAKGEFTDAPQPKPLPLPDLPLAAQPYALDRSSLEACVGGPFYPGIEMTYIALEPKTWSEPFRLDADSFGAGDATKWMACPWQADFYECMIQWWPAQRPDDVITEAIYDEAVSEYQRGHANETFAAMLAGRERWDRDLPFDTGANPTAGDTQMVKSWSEMGFVVERRGPDHKPVFVETERAPYAGKDLREYFYLLLNIDAHQDFLPKARSLAEFYLNAAWEQIQQPDFATPEYRFFDYSKPAFDARLMQIYRAYEQDGKYYDPASDPDYPDREACIYRTQQLAPFNQLDGAWIRTVTQAGPIDEINSLLFAIWADEVGNGDPRLNHCNLYSDLLRDVGVYMPEIRSRAYAQNPALLDAAFDVPVFELSISQFPEEYFPELLGMTLQLEWEVLSLRRTAKLLQYFGINTHFYVMHIGIDNAAEGHGAKAKRAVELFLDHVMQNQGEDGMQRAWRRVWNGYVAFGLTGGLGNAIADFNRARHARNLGERDQLQAAIEQMIADKQEFAQLNHGNKRLGPDYLNDLFEDPTAFTRALIESGYIIPGNPENSPFFSKLTYEGPMFKVFTDEEIQLWMDWTRSLAHSDGHAEKSIAELMVDAVTMLKGRQYGERMHESAFLAGADENGARVVRSVTEWLEGDPLHFLNALRNPENNLILPGYPEASPFIEERLSMDTPMGRAWAAVAPKSRGRSWR
ncbi:MAG: Lysine-epsilon oxidase, partial [Candidatus Eremiobacteraeota bacterium]|nr:Lysine-epsilon oxidase [Candidatus Eremiobacteraeota bacterium]